MSHSPKKIDDNKLYTVDECVALVAEARGVSREEAKRLVDQAIERGELQTHQVFKDLDGSIHRLQ